MCIRRAGHHTVGHEADATAGGEAHGTSLGIMAEVDLDSRGCPILGGEEDEEQSGGYMRYVGMGMSTYAAIAFVHYHRFSGT